MKTQFYLIWVLLCPILLTNCNDKQVCNCSVVLTDYTDTFKSTSDLHVDQFVPKSKVGSPEFYNGYTLRFIPITNVEYTKGEVFTLPLVSKMEANDLNRKKEITDVRNKIDAYISQLKNREKGLDGSVIYAPLFKALNDMAKNKNCTPKTLYIYSDLQENSPLLSTYDPQTLRTIEDNPEQIYALLNAKYPLQDLHGITVYFFHQSKDTADDQSYGIVLKFLTLLFEKQGAKVLTTI